MEFKTKNAREAAYVALMASLKGEAFIADSLDQWRKQRSPSSVDYHFAQQIACGSAQMAVALDYLAEQMSDKKKLSLKLKEKALLRLALYQFYFLDRIPVYAIVDESIKIARKYCHSTFTGFLNATLRKLEEHPQELPKGNTSQELSIRFSYPKIYVDKLIAQFGLEQTLEIMAAGNAPALTMVRVRPMKSRSSSELIPGLETLITAPCVIGILRDTALLPQIGSSPQYYIQNVTPPVLMAKLAENATPPKRILDLCSSPGGKLLAAHDLYPEAILDANDVSPEKLERLSENCRKYGLNANVTCSKGEEFTSDEKYDLIILDVPCSNSGVLNKRPEARWRLTEDSIKDQKKLQMKLITHATTLLAPGGEIWYLTCSILKDENEALIEKACLQLDLKVRVQHSQLPNRDGWDGGFACALRK